MKLYKSSTKVIYAYEPDGSQDHLISDDFVAITEQEADVIRKEIQDQLYQEWLAKQPTKEQQIADLQTQIDALKG